MKHIYQKYLNLIVEWGNKFNLIGTLDPKEIEAKHFNDSKEVIKMLSPKTKRMVDLGTGAGLPGIVLKIERPDIEVVLIDSKGKKVNFCQLVIKELGLKGIEAIWGRAEDKKLIATIGPFDLVVSRATWKLDEYLQRAIKFGKGAEIIAMKGPRWKEELAAAKKFMEKNGIKLIDTHHYILSSGEKRTLLKFKCFT